MQYAKIENGQVVSTNLPKVGILKDGKTVSGYNLLSDEILKQEDWLPIEKEMPVYNEELQTIQFDRYDIQPDKVIMLYTVHDKEVQTLEDLKLQKEQEIDSACSQTILSGFDYNGNHYSFNYDDQINMEALKNNLALGLITEVEWKNSSQISCVVWSGADFMALYNAAMIFKTIQIKKCQSLKELIANAESIEELELISWDI